MPQKSKQDLNAPFVAPDEWNARPLYDNMPDYELPPTKKTAPAFSDADLVGRLRSKYPGVYDQIPDQQLATAVRTKRPDLVAELMQQPNKGTGPSLAPTPLAGVDSAIRTIGKKALLPFEPTFSEGPRLAAASALTGSEQKPLTNATYGEALKSIADVFRNVHDKPSYSYDPRTGKKTYGTSQEDISQATLRGGAGGAVEGAMGISPADWLSLAALGGGPGAIERLGTLWKGLDVGDPLLSRAINALGTVMPTTASAIRNASGVEERMKAAVELAKKGKAAVSAASTVPAEVAAVGKAAPKAAAAATEVPAPAAPTAPTAASGAPFEAQATKLPQAPLKSVPPAASSTVPTGFNGGDTVARQARAEAFDRVANRNGMAQNVVGHTPASTPGPRVKLSAQELLEKSRELSGSTPRADAAFKTTVDSPAGNKAFSTQVKEVAADIGGKGGPSPLRVAAGNAINDRLTPAEQYAGIQRVAEYAKKNPWLHPADLVSGQESRKRLLKALADYEAKGQ